MSDNSNRPLSRFAVVIGSVALTVASSAAEAQYAQQPQGYPPSQPQTQQGYPPSQGYPQQPNYPSQANLPRHQEPTPPPVPGQVDKLEARNLMRDPEFNNGFNSSAGHFVLMPVQARLPIWNNGMQGEYVKAATVYMANFADDVSVMAEQITSSHLNSKQQNGALTGAAYRFTQIAAQQMDALTINWPFQGLVARSGRDPTACAVVQRGGDSVNFPENDRDPEAIRIRMFRIADQARRLSVCLDESVPIGGFIGIPGKAGDWAARHGIHIGVGVQPSNAQGPQWTVDLANRTTDTANRLETAKATLFNLVRDNASLTPEAARQILQQGAPGPHSELKQPEIPLSRSKLPELARAQPLQGEENRF